jgi:hypothetical protein
MPRPTVACLAPPETPVPSVVSMEGTLSMRWSLFEAGVPGSP